MRPLPVSNCGSIVTKLLSLMQRLYVLIPLNYNMLQAFIIILMVDLGLLGRTYKIIEVAVFLYLGV